MEVALAAEGDTTEGKIGELEGRFCCITHITSGHLLLGNIGVHSFKFC